MYNQWIRRKSVHLTLEFSSKDRQVFDVYRNAIKSNAYAVYTLEKIGYIIQIFF